jgi:hypothetical protein|tara:strand:+ start:5324 stop:5578 length:255 start_codon:yes stop_codon:yes gene_type:complete
MAFKKYLKHPTTQTAVDDIIADIYPILQEHYEKKEVSPWELATALVVLLSSVTSSSDLDKEMLLNLTTFIMETTPDQGLFSTKH